MDKRFFMLPRKWSIARKLMWLKLTGSGGGEQWSTIGPDSIVTFTALHAAPLRSLLVTLTPQQSGSGDPSPDNVRPISGYSALTVEQTGKNLLSLSATGRTIITSADYGNTSPRDFSSPAIYVGLANSNYFNNSKINSYEIADDGASISVSVNASGYGVGYTVQAFPSTKYTMSYSLNATNYLAAVFYDADGNYLSNTSNRSFTTPATCHNMILLFKPTTMNTLYEFDEPQLEFGETATDYTAYVGTSIPITIPTPPGTVYGGTLDVVTGVLTVDKESVDIGDLGWAYNSQYTRFSAYLAGKEPSSTGARRQLVYSPIYMPITDGRALANVPDYSIYTGSSDTNDVYIKDSRYTDPQVFATAMTGTIIVYPLATPQTYQLTPEEVTALVGTNNVWADSGTTVTVVYRSN